MPSKTKLRTELSGDYKLNHKKSSRHHHGSKIPQDKALSPRATQSLKFKEKIVSPVSQVHPPQADFPSELVKHDHKGLYVHSRVADNQQVQQVNKVGTSREEELVKYMSKLPSYLQTGDRVVQDNVLNFGVLDWERLEKWKRKQDRRENKKTGSSAAGSSSSTSTTATSSSGSQYTSSSSRVDSRAGKPPRDDERRKATNYARDPNKQVPISKQQYELDGDASGVKLPRVGEKKRTSYQKSKLGPRTSSHPGNEESSSSKETITDPDCRREDRRGHQEDRTAKGKSLETHPSCQQHSHPKKDTVILLLPKDFSRPNSSEISERTSLDYGASSSEFNWNSFSDVFSMEEVQSEDSFLDFPHSCPLTYPAESEAELDLKLDNLINSRGVEIESDLPSQSPKWDEASAAASKSKDAKNNSESISEAPKGLEQEAAGSLDSEMANTSAPRRFSFGMGRLSRSLSFREGVALPQISSTYVSAKSGPVRTEVPTDCPGSNANGRMKNSPFRRLLDPWLKHRATKSFSSTLSLQSCPEDSLDDFNIRPGSALEALFCEKSSSTSTATAYLQVAFKGGLPWFRFMVKTTNEILASTVKKLSTFEKDDPNWLYTFYSVHKVKKKSSGWRHQVSKQKNTELSSTPVGQMKVSDAHIEQGEIMKHKAMESVLYGVDLNNTDEPTTEFTANKELAAIVVKMPGGESLSTTTINDSQNGNLSSEFSGNAAEENEKSGNIVVILPSGYHALPAEGVPSPLIKRWRTGGLCDCGGWDVGCKLRILTNETPEHKISRASSLNDRCDLFAQGAAKQTKPIFSIVSDGNGIFSVEYDAVISSLQAFSICVAFVNSQKVADALEQKLHNESRQERERLRTPVDILGDGHAKYAAYPPHSPVGRV